MRIIKKIVIAIIVIVVLFFVVKTWKNYNDEKKAAALLGPRTGAVLVSKSSATDNWNTVDVSACKMLNTDSTLIKGIWLGPWDGLYNRTLAPDHNAAYYETLLPILAPQTFGKAYFEIKAEFPEARFMSYHLYNEKFVLEGDSHITDINIQPDIGSVNPYLTGYPIPAGKNKNYTLIVDDFKKLGLTGSNILFGGVLASGDAVKSHSIMIRYYDPKRQEGDLPGLVPQPQVLFKYLDSDPLSAEIRENPCQLFDNTRYAGVMKAEGVDAFAVGKVDFFEKLAGERKYPGYLPEDKPGYEGPEWLFGGNMVCTILYLFPEGTVLADGLDEFSMKFAGVSPKDYLARGQCGPEFGRGAFNYDNRYIFSFLDPTRGETVMRVKNLKAAKYGQDMTRKDNDVRFWSLCVIQAENVMYTYACARDDQFVPDKSDPNFSTFIFTKKADKPAWACDVANVLGEGLSKDCKYNWLPYVSPVTWLYLRTLDANPLSPAYKYLPITFDLKKEAGGDPNNFEAVKKHMGPYYPDGEYCTFGATDTTQKSCEELLK